jgi:hypothetical protein
MHQYAQYAAVHSLHSFLKLAVGLSLMEELLQLADCCAGLEQWHPEYAQASHLALDCNLEM